MTGTIPTGGRQTIRPPGLGGIAVELSTFVPEGALLIRGPGPLEVVTPGGRALIVNPCSRDRYGSPSWLVRALDPHPGYTRHTLGEREIERDRRLRNRPVRFH